MSRSGPGFVPDLSSATKLPETVAVVITTYNDSEFLVAAVQSVLAQSHPADEIVVVDDGSNESPAALLQGYSQVSLLHKSNGGLSSARNYGLLAVHSSYVTFLDADDLLAPQAIAAGLRCFREHPHAALVYGGHRRVDVQGRPLGSNHVWRCGQDAYKELLTTNFIGMHATVLYRRDVLLAEQGFDETLRMCEDYDVYLRIARQYPIVGYQEIVAEYRRHGRNMSSNNQQMLQAVLAVHDRHRFQSQQVRRRAWHLGQHHWQTYYRPNPLSPTKGKGVPEALVQIVKRIANSVVRRAKKRLRGGRIHRIWARTSHRWPPLVGAIRFGDFASTKPISMDFGYDRGNPVDRYYIENFLEKSSPDIQGRVLEVAEDTYSKRFGGGKIVQQDVLHYCLPEPIVTIIGDLTEPGVLPEQTFDCIILTQTLQLIFELEKAVTRLHAALKPGGVLLLTVPGISQIERTDWNKNWCWSFTEASVRRLFERSFAPEDLQITQHGNVFAATMFLHGVAVEELDKQKLDFFDEAYPVILTLRAQRS